MDEVKPRPDGHGEAPFTCADAPCRSIDVGCGLHTLDIRDRSAGWAFASEGGDGH